MTTATTPGASIYRGPANLEPPYRLDVALGQSGAGAYITVGDGIAYLTDRELVEMATAILDNVAQRVA